VRRHRRRVLTVLATAAVALAGCGGTDAPRPGDGTGGEPGAGASGSGGTAAGGTAPATIRCGDVAYDPDAFAQAPPASSLPEGPAGAVDDAGDPAVDLAAGWRVVRVTDERAELLRELDEPLDLDDGDVRTHELRVVERITGATNVPDGTWMLTAAGPCTPRVDLGNLGQAALTLAATPSPDDRTVALHVHERACASGQAAEGRVELVTLEETSDEVRLLVGVRGLGGAQTCPSNPPTPFTVELGEPLGDRVVVDVATVPPRPLTTG
jgi:hypothetical protein